MLKASVIVVYVTAKMHTHARVCVYVSLPEMSGHRVILLRIRFRKLPPSNVWRTFRRTLSVSRQQVLRSLVQTKSVQHSTYAN